MPVDVELKELMPANPAGLSVTVLTLLDLVALLCAGVWQCVPYLHSITTLEVQSRHQ